MPQPHSDQDVKCRIFHLFPFDNDFNDRHAVMMLARWGSKNRDKPLCSSSKSDKFVVLFAMQCVWNGDAKSVTQVVFEFIKEKHIMLQLTHSHSGTCILLQRCVPDQAS